MDKYIIKCGRLLDCVNSNIQQNKYIHVEYGLIKKITHQPEKGYEMVDFGEYTVMPGLINCHTHICLIPDADVDAILKYSIPEITLIAAENAKRYLYSGVTTIRDLGGVEQISIHIRNCINRQLINGPNILTSGQLLTMTGGHGHTTGMECDGVAECKKAARIQLKRGADIIKFMATGGVLTKGVEPGSPQLSEEEMRSMVIEAHNKGKKCAAHAQGKEGIQNAVRAGVDSIEHGFYMNEETVDMMVKNNVYYVPTFSPPYYIYQNGIESGIDADFVRKIKECMKPHKQSFEMCLQKGVKIAAGTDGGTPFNLHENTYNEIVLLHKNGMTKYDAILAATKNAAECLDLNDRGIINEGKVADIIAIKGNPLENLDCLKDVKRVIKTGKIII